MSSIRIAIIGLGYWGPNLVRNFFELDGCEVVYGCDADKSCFDRIQKQYPGVILTTNIQEIWEDESIDAVAIATPVHTHFALAQAALEHGKHVLLEKPMTRTVEEAESLIELAKQKKRVLAVDHTFLFTSAIRKIKELVERGELGDIYYFDSERINLGLIQKDVNVLWDLAPHDISIMQYLFAGAKPIRVFATGTNHIQKGVQEMAHLTVTFDSGAVGHVHTSWISPVKIRKVLVGGSKKMVLYNDMEPHEKVKVYDKGVDVQSDEITPFKPAYRSGDIYIPRLDQIEALRLVAQDFLDQINGAQSSVISAEKGREVVRILEACDKSMASGTAVAL